MLKRVVNRIRLNQVKKRIEKLILNIESMNQEEQMHELHQIRLILDQLS